MKSTFQISILSFLLLLLFSCEKVIDIKVADNEEKYVIEGNVINEVGPTVVKVSRTKNFNDNNDFNGIGGAIVKIENNNTSILLQETSKGIYETNAITGTPGQTYKLSVNVGDKSYTASSTMPQAVPFDDFYLKPNGFDSLRTVTYVKFKDPANINNYYWFELFINDKKQRNYDVRDDAFTPGQEVRASITFENKTDDLSKNLKKGDKLGIEMHSIDASVYLYLFSLFGAEGSGNNAAPANPLSNISGGALGFFSAHTTQKRTLVIP